MLKDNEEVYDERISPLMARIIEICTEHGIPMLATFEYAPGDLCTSRIPVDDESSVFAEAMRVIRPPSAPPMTFRVVHGDGSQTVTTVIA